jgi:hypothetical protein
MKPLAWYAKNVRKMVWCLIFVFPERYTGGRISSVNLPARSTQGAGLSLGNTSIAQRNIVVPCLS